MKCYVWGLSERKKEHRMNNMARLSKPLLTSTPHRVMPLQRPCICLRLFICRYDHIKHQPYNMIMFSIWRPIVFLWWFIDRIRAQLCSRSVERFAVNFFRLSNRRHFFAVISLRRSWWVPLSLKPFPEGFFFDVLILPPCGTGYDT